MLNRVELNFVEEVDRVYGVKLISPGISSSISDLTAPNLFLKELEADELILALQTFGLAISKYPPSYIRFLKLSGVRLSRTLEMSAFEGENEKVAGTFDQSNRFINIAGSHEYVTHHELEHARVNPLYDRILGQSWFDTHPEDEPYYLTFLKDFEKKAIIERGRRGFVTKYGETKITEDVACIAQHLFTTPNAIPAAKENDEILYTKLVLLANNIARDFGADGKEWLMSILKGRIPRFYRFTNLVDTLDNSVFIHPSKVEAIEKRVRSIWNWNKYKKYA